MRFTRAFTPNPICTPSRAAILTGQDSWTNGSVFFGDPIREESPLWPRQLAASGYETFYTGKWHNDGRPASRGFTSGAEIWLGGNYDHANLPVVQYGQDRGQRQPAAAYSSTLFVDAAIRFLEERDTDSPFGLFVSFTVPHDPWTAPDGYDTMYDARDIPLPSNYMPRPPFEIAESFSGLRDQQQLPWPRPEWAVRAALSQYYGMISHMDAQIGRLFDRLDQLGLFDNTVIIFVGDHGYSMASHGFVGKQTMYEEGIRTPLIIHHPKLRQGSPTDSHLVSLVDLYPTIIDAAGMDVPESVEGRSLLGLYQGDDNWPRDHLFASFHSPTSHEMSTRAIRTQRHKLIHHLLTDEVELFDLRKDPYELNNLAGRPRHASLQKTLMKRLKDWRADTPEK